MSYTVLARKYRSQTFDEIVGQEAIATTLKNAVASGRIHHGYLFTGTRGVGKTSMARIMAKALNCLAADEPTTQPCCKCELCVAVAEGHDVDVIEIDAASNTGVDNIRELRGSTIYRPARARFKVYIIDEVHMLSQGAFNALLKTLEEPPGHVKFIFATTEAQRVPATIQSRCQRFDFRSISVDKIGAQLAEILKAEKVDADEDVIRRVARLANGSMRDGLSLLDQLLSLGAKKLAVELIDEILPAPHNELLAGLVDSVALGDAAGGLVALDRCLNEGHSLEQLCASLIDYYRQLLVVRVCGAETDLIDVPAPVREKLAGQASRFDAAGLTYLVTISEELRRSVRFSGSGRALTEAAIVRMASMERFAAVETLLAGLGESGGAAQAATRPQATRPQPAGQGGAGRAASGGAAPSRSSGGGAGEAGSTSSTPAARRRARSAESSQPVAQQSASKAPARRTLPVSGEERREALADPMVQKTLDLFDGDLTNIEKTPSPGPTASSEESDS
ncbi:MAG: DNA polymerase III subunit gamma/tau [Phycisphaerae bacterium]|nr:DNA polymerase III subunit gamma/tau [Phycisphaerae bacterium]